MADVTYTASAFQPAGGVPIDTGIAGEAIEVGDNIYLNSSGRWVRSFTDSDANATVQAKAVTAAAGSGNIVAFVRPGPNVLINVGSVLAIGHPYAISNTTAGKDRPASDIGTNERVVWIGAAKSASILLFNVTDPDASTGIAIS